MLKNSLYQLSSLHQNEAGAYVAKVKLDATHEIFEGHFPGQPILPGVCLLEMVKEILITIRNKPLQLKSAATIKYLKLVDPSTDPELIIEIAVTGEEELLKVNVSSFLADGSANFKMKASYT